MVRHNLYYAVNGEAAMKEDLTGRQFGRLFVVGDGGKIIASHFWIFNSFF